MNKKTENTYVGYCDIELIDDQVGVSFPMAIMYPTDIPEKTEKIGPYNMNVSMNAVLKKGEFPLVLISHGSGGGHLLYRTLAHHLARNGFIVGMPEHPFNNRNNNSLEGTVENLINRPRHLNIAINWFFDSERFGNCLKPDSVSIIGHSMGGYTALAIAGGLPTSFPHESPDGQPHQIKVIPYNKIKALVLLAPASVWFMEKDALNGVNIPIMMITAEKDEYTPSFHAQIILEGVHDSEKALHRVVKNAGHFSFLSPFPEFMVKKEFFPSQDPPGFSRQEFHDEMNDEILDFLLRKI